MVFDSMPALPAWMAELAAGSGGAAAKAEQDEKWINNFIDDLTVAVAMRDWDAAVELVVKGKSKSAPSGCRLDYDSRTKPNSHDAGAII